MHDKRVAGSQVFADRRDYLRNGKVYLEGVEGQGEVVNVILIANFKQSYQLRTKQLFNLSKNDRKRIRAKTKRDV